MTSYLKGGRGVGGLVNFSIGNNSNTDNEGGLKRPILKWRHL